MPESEKKEESAESREEAKEQVHVFSSSNISQGYNNIDIT